MVKKKKEKKKKRIYSIFNFVSHRIHGKKKTDTYTYMHPKYYITKEPLAIEFQINHNRVTK